MTTGSTFTVRCRTSMGVGLILALLFSVQLHAGIVLTADTEGHVGPCQECPLHTGLGSLARRATAIGDLRKADAELVLVDAGNAFIGSESLQSEGKVIVAAYNALSYDVVNVSHKDFRLGKTKTVAMLSGAKFAAVSANLVDGESGQPLFKPYVVKQADGQKVAFVGLTEVPVGVKFLAHLKQQLAGVTIQPPAEALAAWLPKAKAEADRVVIVFHGSAASLKPVQDAAGAQVSCILVGGARPQHLPADAVPPLIGVSEHGKHLAKVSVVDKPQATLIAVEASLALDPQLEKVIAEFQKKPASPATMPVKAANDVLSQPALEINKIYPVNAMAQNRGLRMTVINATLVQAYGGVTAPKDRLWLVLATEWENTIPLTVVERKGKPELLPTEYNVPDLADHIYVVIDGVRVARVRPDSPPMPGHIPLKNFGIADVGGRLRGTLAFDVPGTMPKSLQIRFYDLMHGHFSMMLAGNQPATAQPLKQTRSNQVMDAGVFGVKRDAELGGRKAPPGMTFISLDFRAESTFKADADATAFDPKATHGSKTKKAIFADWAEWQKYTYLLVDGQYAYGVETQLSDLPPIPRLLPEVRTGGTMVFLSPADAKEISLKLDFPGARSGAQIIRPNGLDLLVEGTYQRPPKREPLLVIEDDIFKVAIVGQQVVDSYGRFKPKGQFLLLELEVQNSGRQGEFFQVKDQLKLVDEKAQQLTIADATYAGVRRPTPLVFIPETEKRAFTVVYDVPASLAKPRLAYAGVSMAKVFDLPAIAPAAIAGSQPVNRPATGPAVAGVNTPPVKPITPKTTPKQPALPARVAARQPTKPLGLAAAGLKPEQVNEAIDRGASFLWKEIEKDLKERDNQQYSGYHGLYLLALVHADYHKKDAACETEVRRYLSNSDPVYMGTYAAGIYLMLAESFGDSMYMPKITLATRYLIESQGKGGTWGYSGNRNSKLYAEPEPDLSQPLSIVGGRPTEGPGSDGAPIQRISKPEEGEDGDNSVTQYAILGLHSASRMGLEVPQEVWKRTYDAVKAWQQEDGGWGYHGDRSYGSMVCAGIGTLTLCRHHLGERDPAADEVIEHGIGWLDHKFSVSENPGYDQSWLYYYLYGMERVGRILDTEFIGDHEWYPFGTKALIKNQMPNGSWVHTSHEAQPPLPTSFALLFLTRATPSLSIAKRTGPGTLKTEVVAPPMNRIYIIMDASGSMLEEMNGKQKFAIAQEAVIALIESLPANSEVALRAYGYRKRAIEKDADLDTSLIVPMAKLDKKKLTDVVRGLRCRGKTPLATSLIQAAADLAGASDKAKPITLVLLTDGGEDTFPRQNPVKAAEGIAKLAGVSFQVVGFDINRQDWSEQLLATARAGQGQYLPAAKADVLLDRLHAAIYRSPDQWVVTDKDGKEIARGTFGQSVKLPSGKYTVTTSLAGLAFSREAWVNPESTTLARFDAVRVDFGKASAAPTTPPSPAALVPPIPTAPARPPLNQPKFCTNCGKPLTPGVNFCTNCGRKVGG